MEKIYFQTKSMPYSNNQLISKRPIFYLWSWTFSASGLCHNFHRYTNVRQEVCKRFQTRWCLQCKLLKTKATYWWPKQLPWVQHCTSLCKQFHSNNCRQPLASLLKNKYFSLATGGCHCGHCEWYFQFHSDCQQPPPTTSHLIQQPRWSLARLYDCMTGILITKLGTGVKLPWFKNSQLIA